jgi:hypothetical protein
MDSDWIPDLFTMEIYNYTHYNYNEHYNTDSFLDPTDGTVLRRLTWRTDLFCFQTLTGDDSLTHWRRLTNSFRCQRLTNSLLCIAFPLQHRAVPMENTRPRLLGNHATRQYWVVSVSMKPIVVLGMTQPYPGYGCEQVTIVASRILDTIVAFGQTCHNTLHTYIRGVPKRMVGFRICIYFILLTM